MNADSVMVSIIMPVYNAQKTLARCLDSVLSQSYSALEVLAIDDGSTDDSLAILHRYAQVDTRLRVLTQANSGVAASRNRAINAATGEYLQFVDSDDLLPLDSTANMVLALQSQHCELTIAPYTEVLGSQRQTRGFLRRDAVLTRDMLLDNLSAHPTSFFYAVMWNKLYRRDLIVLNSIRCDARLDWGEDFAFNMRYFAHVEHVAVLSTPVYDYIRNMTGLSFTTGRACLLHPIHGIQIKLWLHRYYKELFVCSGLYEEYRKVLPKYLFWVTLNN
ncbi:MAG: glycosyltransferase [Clostridia bacterium]